MKPAVLLVAGLAVLPARAAEVETQHAFDVTVALRPRLDLVLHSRIRTQPARLGFYQIRGGPILSWRLRPRLALLSGYYYAQQEQIDNDFIGGHRPFGGGEGRIVNSRWFSLDQRFLAERFLANRASDFNRFRARTLASARVALGPYGSYELFADASGWRSTRYSGGIRWRVLPAAQLDLGYFYERRRANVGPNRHMWIVSFQVTGSRRRGDPDR